MKSRQSLAVLGLAALAVTLASCNGTADPEADAGPATAPPRVPAGDLSVLELTVGVCSTAEQLVAGADAGQLDLSTFPAVDCDSPHDVEVYHVHEMTDETFPGAGATTAVAEQECLAAFEPFVGMPYATSSLDFTYFMPTETTWDEAGDRDVVCMVLASEPREGSFQDSRL
ncbi:MAG TPA: septum formation family protein [Actinomycetaceae bacterium]|nr:septum formation family protein [Actinomycetaceae bacterium]